VADNGFSMSLTPLPTAFALLEKERNLAADAALAEALPHMDASLRRVALQLIIDRGHAVGLGGVVGRFRSFPFDLQELVLARMDELYGGVRAAIRGGELEGRLGAIELIKRSGECKLAYLLGAALRSHCRDTRKQAAQTLNLLTSRCLNGTDDRSSGDLANRVAQRPHITDAIRQGIMSWEAHVRPEVLQAALWLGDAIEKTICQKLAESRTHIVRAIMVMLEGTVDVGLAGFVLRALAIPELRAPAVNAISQARDKPFIQALASECWLLTDPEIRRGCLRVRELRWLSDDVYILLELPVPGAVRIVRFIGASGLRSDHKVAIYRATLELSDEALDRAVVWELVEDKSSAATDLLATLAGRVRGEVSRVAARELKQRGLDSFLDVQCFDNSSMDEIDEDSDPALEKWDRFWTLFDHLSPEQRKSSAIELQQAGFDLPQVLRAKLAGAIPTDRAKALRVVPVLGLVRELSEQAYHLTNDPDATVRSTAVSLLAEIPGVTSQRILRRAANDIDRRVQANAISALDELGADDRRKWIEPKLESPDNRVRANAVKALLEMEFEEAGEVLLGMLEAPSPAHKLSALWVVERLRLRTLLHRLDQLSRNDSDRRVRQRAERVLGELSGEMQSATLVDDLINAEVRSLGEGEAL